MNIVESHPHFTKTKKVQ